MAPTNSEQEYMKHKLNLCDAIMDFIYEKQDKLIESKLVQIARENQRLINATTPTFMFQGDWYPESLIDQTMTKPFNTALDISLYEKVNLIINPDNWEQEMERVRIKHCVSRFTMMAKTIKDLHNLFPAQILSYLEKTFTLEDMENAPDPLSADDIIAIKKQNSQALLSLNKLFVTRLLLSNI